MSFSYTLYASLRGDLSLTLPAIEFSSQAFLPLSQVSLSYHAQYIFAHCCYLVLDENITGQSQLNCMEWRKKNGDKKTLRLKEMMSVKWKEMGQNLIITDARLKGFEDKYWGDNEACMDSVITEWFSKTSEKVW